MASTRIDPVALGISAPVRSTQLDIDLMGKLTSRGVISDVVRNAFTILKRYGTDAHLYLPGIGIINGFTAGNYLESTGTTAATVDNPVGLVLDAANSQLGSELVTNGTFDVNTASWSAVNGATLSVDSGKLRVSNTGAYGYAAQNITTVVGKTYKITFNCIDGTAPATVMLVLSPSLQLTQSNSPTYFVATSTVIPLRLYASNTVVGAYAEFDNISIKEVTGIHARQSTTADKMILRSTNGRYWWDAVDATDKLLITYPAGYESVTIVDAAPSGQTTLESQNIVGTYAISTDTYGRFVFKTITASELAIIQQFANRSAGL